MNITLPNITPGTWIASCNDDDSEEPNAIRCDGVLIATVEDSPEIRARHNRGKIERPGSTASADSLDEVDANATLIAAAPEMMRALKACFDAIQRTGVSVMQRQMALDVAGNALLKAGSTLE